MIFDKRVDFFDTDLMQVTHHANYVRWFEIARIEYLRSIGITLDEIMQDGYLFPIRDLQIHFHSPSHFDEILQIEVTPTALTAAKMEFEYKITRKDPDKTRLIVSGKSQNVFTNMKSGKISKLPARYVDAFKKVFEE